MTQQPPAGPLGTGVAVTHILVVADPARSRDFWVDVWARSSTASTGERAWCCASPTPGCS